MRCLGILSRRVASGSLGCASAISGRGTGLHPGPGSMSTASANHGWRLGCAAVERTASSGSVVRQWNGRLAAAQSCGSGKVQGRAGGRDKGRGL